MFGFSELNEVYGLELEDGRIAYTGRIRACNDPDADPLQRGDGVDHTMTQPRRGRERGRPRVCGRA